MKNSKLKERMKNETVVKKDIIERRVNYSLRIVKLYRQLEKDSVGRVLGKQLLRSGTATGQMSMRHRVVRAELISSPKCPSPKKKPLNLPTGFALSKT